MVRVYGGVGAEGDSGVILHKSSTFIGQALLVKTND